jgi:hypothetical protein
MHFLILVLSLATGMSSVVFLNIYGISWEEHADIRMYTNTYALYFWVFGNTCSLVGIIFSLYVYTYANELYSHAIVILPCLLITLALIELFVVLKQRAFFVIFMIIHCTLLFCLIVSCIIYFPEMLGMHIINIIWGIHTATMQRFHYWYLYIYEKQIDIDIEKGTDMKLFAATDMSLSTESTEISQLID